MADRDELGRLLPGHSIKGGRKRSEISQAILDAIVGAFTPDEIRQNLRDAFDTAKRQGSAKGMIMAMAPTMEYGPGKPVIRIERTEGDPISAALDELRRIHAEKQTTYTVIEANIDNTENAR
jgi:hypothetical protein